MQEIHEKKKYWIVVNREGNRVYGFPHSTFEEAERAIKQARYQDFTVPWRIEEIVK